MKTGRNDPCPCGSGKKYKKCCYIDESKSETQKQREIEESLEMQEQILKTILQFRKYFLEKKPHIKEYYKIRRMHSEIVNAMAQYQEEGKFKQEISAPKLANPDETPVIMLIDSSFDLTTRIGAQGFFDLQIYKPASNMSCITEDFIQKNRYRKPEKIEFLHSMLDSKLGLFEIIGTDEDEGYVQLRDVFTNAGYTITDVGLSGHHNYSDIYIYTRIITYNGISFSTGLNFIFEKTDEFIHDHIKQHMANYNEKGSFLRFTQLYNYYSEEAGEKVRTVRNDPSLRRYGSEFF